MTKYKGGPVDPAEQQPPIFHTERQRQAHIARHKACRGIAEGIETIARALLAYQGGSTVRLTIDAEPADPAKPEGRLTYRFGIRNGLALAEQDEVVSTYYLEDQLFRAIEGIERSSERIVYKARRAAANGAGGDA